MKIWPPTLAWSTCCGSRADMPPALLNRTWRFLGYLYELHGDPLDALVCYLQTLPPTDHPLRAGTFPPYVSGALAAFDFDAGQDVVDQAFARRRDPTWTPPPFPATALPPYTDPPAIWTIPSPRRSPPRRPAAGRR